MACILDALAAFGAGMGSLYLTSATPGAPAFIVVGAVALLAAIGLWERGSYTLGILFAQRLHLTRLTAAWLQAVGLGVLITLCTLTVLRHEGTIADGNTLAELFDGPWLPAFVASGLGALALLRVGRRRVFLKQVPPRRAVVVGATALCQQVLERLDRDGNGGLNIVGIVEYGAAQRSDSLASLRAFYGRTVLGGMPALLELVR
ncbi:MAG: hypothetical protein J0H35_00005, partial [Rhodospirillales bacterium]|nr:hypothetical protein [Rhodospirillales bacterium]